MKLEFTEEWCMRMANLEGDSEIGAGKPMDDLTERLRDLDKKGYQPLTGAIGEEAADTIDRLRAEVASLKEERDQAVEGHRAAHQVSVECTKKLHLCEGSYSVLDAENEALKEAISQKNADIATWVERDFANQRTIATLMEQNAQLQQNFADALLQVEELEEELQVTKQVMWE